MITLQTVYPYGLTDTVSDEYMAEKESRVVGNKFVPLHGLYKVQIIITIKLNFIILSWNKILLKS